MEKKKLTITEIKNKIENIQFENFDLVVAIGKGGLKPARLVADYLKLSLKIINIKFRDKNNKPIYKRPIVVNNKNLFKKILINNKKIIKNNYDNRLIRNNNILKLNNDRLLNKENKNIKINLKNKNQEALLKSLIIDKNRLTEIKNKKILIVDDISRTGSTLKKAKQILKNNKTKTFVINGKADYSLYNFKECIEWPWKN